jgi:hypothetical protein
MPPTFIWTDINLWAVLVSGLANIIICLVLYLPKIFGNTWMKLTGKDLNPVRQWMALGIFGHLINALVLAVIITVFNATTMLQGLEIVFMVWLGFFIPLEAGELVWDKIPFRLFLLRVGVLLVSECVTGFILVIWR